MRIQHHCVQCGKLMAEEVRSRKRTAKEHFSGLVLRPKEGAEVKHMGIGIAPRVRCNCGLLHIIVKGSM